MQLMAKPFEWPVGFSSLILFANKGVAEFDLVTDYCPAPG
jgi:hypothetical protein